MCKISLFLLGSASDQHVSCFCVCCASFTTIEYIKEDTSSTLWWAAIQDLFNSPFPFQWNLSKAAVTLSVALTHLLISPSVLFFFIKCTSLIYKFIHLIHFYTIQTNITNCTNCPLLKHHVFLTFISAVNFVHTSFILDSTVCSWLSFTDRRTV